jgi:prepilin-type N-terminal cleavage/methylation domain-containing protein
VKIKKQNKQKGFSLMELVVGVAIFAILATGLLTSFSVLSRSVRAARIQTAIATIASNELEILHNLPYSQIGTVNGNPNGSLPDQNNPQTVVFDSRNYKVYYEVTYIDDPADGTILAGTDSAFTRSSFFIAPIVILFPLRVRPFDFVLCPRDGRLLACLTPR